MGLLVILLLPYMFLSKSFGTFVENKSDPSPIQTEQLNKDMSDHVQYQNDIDNIISNQVINMSDLLKSGNKTIIYNSVIYNDYQEPFNLDHLYMKVFNSTFIIQDTSAVKFLHSNSYSKMKYYIKNILTNYNLYDIEFKDIRIK
jgi:hypothetical protein